MTPLFHLYDPSRFYPFSAVATLAVGITKKTFNWNPTRVKKSNLILIGAYVKAIEDVGGVDTFREVVAEIRTNSFVKWTDKEVPQDLGSTFFLGKLPWAGWLPLPDDAGGYDIETQMLNKAALNTALVELGLIIYDNKR